MRKWVLLAAIMAAPAAAMGQAAPQAGTPSANEFAAVMQDEGHRQDVLNAAQATPGWAQTACKTATYTQAPEVGVYAPIRFDAQGAPISGEWREGIVVTGCGQTHRLNVLTKVTAPATLATGPLLPGSTIADPVLQNAAQFYALKAAGGLPPGCTQAYIADTIFGGYETKPTADTAAAPWQETWTLNLCGPPTRITLHFIPSAQGVSVRAVPAK
jgi:hypothetical protein